MKMKLRKQKMMMQKLLMTNDLMLLLLLTGWPQLDPYLQLDNMQQPFYSWIFISLLESILSRKLKFFGHVTWKSGIVWRKKSSKVPCQEQEYKEDHAQLDKTTSRHGQSYRWWKQWGQWRTIHNATWCSQTSHDWERLKNKTELIS